jgi:hypothetical protein
MTPGQQLLFRCIFIGMAGVSAVSLFGYILQIRSERRAARLEKQRIAELRQKLGLPTAE